DLKTGRPVEMPDARYYAHSDKRALVIPGPLGAHNWHAMSYSPQTGLVYIPAMDSAALFEVGAPTETALLGGGHLRIDQGLGTDTELHYKVTGRLIAWDPVSQKERWHRDLQLPINGGVLSTAGDLVIEGSATGEITAYEANSGAPLWSMATGSAIQAAPTTVMVDGEQFILVPVGVGGAMSNWSRFSYPEVAGARAAVGFQAGRPDSTPAVLIHRSFPEAASAASGHGARAHGRQALRGQGLLHVPCGRSDARQRLGAGLTQGFRAGPRFLRRHRPGRGTAIEGNAVVRGLGHAAGSGRSSGVHPQPGVERL